MPHPAVAPDSVPAATITESSVAGTVHDPEWLLTDGYGGFAMGTASGVASRRYHAWLIASQKPPLDRVVVLRTCAERLTLPSGRDVWLAGLRFGGEAPSGGVVLPDSFKPKPARWTYRFGGEGMLTRGLDVSPGTVRIRWRWEGEPGARLLARPLTPLSDFHALARSPEPIACEMGVGRALLRGPDADAEMTWSRGGWFHAHETWWNATYAHEQNRGYDFTEDVPSPGHLEVDLDDGPVTLSLRETRTPAEVAPEPRSDDPADAFVVRSGGPPGDCPSRTVLAGYPWFGDWGRDTMIALPGLLLDRGLFDDARDVLARFAGAISRGLLPNRFSDSGEGAEYNTADASLWFLHAATEWAMRSGEAEEFTRVLLPACLAIVDAYTAGTEADGAPVGVDPEDGLVVAGHATSQLTWMDARRDGVTFTPRHGKPIELSALWVHGLTRLAGFDTGGRRGELKALAERAAESVRRLFYDGERGWCADRLEADGTGWRPVFELRPNQLFAVSLEYGPMRGEPARRLVRSCVDRLWTPRGVRTLDPADPAYRPRFEGTMFERDASYHQGTAWPWLLGPMVEAWQRAELPSADAVALIRPMLSGTGSPLPGQIAEVYDADGWAGTPASWALNADDPQRPGGCPAQAWSVSEVFRAARLLGLVPVPA